MTGVQTCALPICPTRRAFAEQERPLTAKTPVHTNRDCFPKSKFAIDLEKMEVRCPAGHTSNDFRAAKTGGGNYLFGATICQACPLRSQCVRGKGPRSVSIQAEEALQQQACAHNQTEAGRRSLPERVVVEHRISRLVQLGIRHSRYFGKTKTRLQLVLASVVANVSLVRGYLKRQARSTELPCADAAASAKTGLRTVLSALWIFSRRPLACRQPVWAWCQS